MSAARPFPIDDLRIAARCASDDELERLLGFQHGAVRRQRQRGDGALSIQAASDWSDRLRIHPASIWPNYCDEIIDHEERQLERMAAAQRRLVARRKAAAA